MTGWGGDAPPPTLHACNTWSVYERAGRVSGVGTINTTLLRFSRDYTVPQGRYL